MSTSDPGQRGRANLVLGIVVAVVVVALDQWTKTLATQQLSRPIQLFGPLSLRLVYNSGVAFSVGAGLGLPIVLIALSVIAVYGYRRRHHLNRPVSLGAGLVAGGALSNLGDRIFRGHGGSVVDFIYTTFWPTFNVADSAVVCGCIVLFFCYWGSQRRRSTGSNSTSAHSNRSHPAVPRSVSSDELSTGDDSYAIPMWSVLHAQ